MPGTATANSRDLDHHFGESGKVTNDIGRNDRANGVAIDAQGRIVVAGFTGHRSQNDFLVARYMPDGSLDGSFGSGGIVTTDFNGRDDQAHAVELDTNGRIVVAGTSRGNGGGIAAIARYEPGGALDPSFGGDGRVLANLGTYDTDVNAMAIDSQGRIVVAGRRYLYHDVFNAYDFVLARFNDDGKLDPSFGTGGKVATDFGQMDSANALALDSHGRIVAAGESEFETSSFVVARYNPNGTLDPSFGGSAHFGDGVYSDSASAVTVDGRGRVVAAGGADRESGEADFALARYASGRLDPSFGTGGAVTTAFADFAAASAVLVDGQGRIVAVGSNVNAAKPIGQFALARYGSHGALDPTFGTAGEVTTGFGRGNAARADAAVVASRDRIVAVGSVDDGSGTDLALARYTGKDRTAPDVTVTGHSRFRTSDRRRRAHFRMEASEPASFQCKIDGRAFHRCSSPYRTPRLAIGHHRLNVRATDEAGNTGSDEKRFRIVEKR